MAKDIKLDLHTHPFEALKKEMDIKGIGDIKKDVVQKIVKAIKSAGIDGIAITEHDNFNLGLVASYEIMDHFKNENLFIFPGVESEENGQHFISIFVPDYLKKRIPFFNEKDWVKIMVHPGHYNPIADSDIQNLSCDYVEKVSLLGEFSAAETIHKEIGIKMIEASDAHTLEDIGKRFISVNINR